MSKKHPPYAPEFRRQMIELIRAGRTAEQLAKEFEPSAQAIRNWVAQAYKAWIEDANGNVIERAVGTRLTELAMSPPKVRAAIDARGAARAAT